MKTLRVTPLIVGQMQENCYLVSSDLNSECFIIDPGDDATYIAEKILEKQLHPVGIIATHGHFDHVMAAFELQLLFTIPFYIHKKDKFLLDRMSETAEHFLKHTIVELKPQISTYLQTDLKLSLGGSDVEIIEAPGHTPGSVCLYFASSNLAFVGDLLFAQGNVGRTDFSYGRPLELHDSIEKILKLPGNTTLYTGHGEVTTVESEMVYHRSRQ